MKQLKYYIEYTYLLNKKNTTRINDALLKTAA